MRLFCARAGSLAISLRGHLRVDEMCITRRHSHGINFPPRLIDADLCLLTCECFSLSLYCLVKSKKLITKRGVCPVEQITIISRSVVLFTCYDMEAVLFRGALRRKRNHRSLKRGKVRGVTREWPPDLALSRSYLHIKILMIFCNFFFSFFSLSLSIYDNFKHFFLFLLLIHMTEPKKTKTN
jgi:hypothetical protein